MSRYDDLKRKIAEEDSFRPHPKGTLVLRDRTKVRCWFKKYGCQGHLETITHFASGEKLDDKQAVCSECGVLYIGDVKKASEANPRTSLIAQWLNNHKDIIERAKSRRLRVRIWRWLTRRNRNYPQMTK